MSFLAWTIFTDVEVETLAGWAVVLSALSVVGVIWIVHSLHRLATNQVKLGAILEQLLRQLNG